MNSQALFIAATGQNVGKSTICLGIVAGLQKRFSSVGFIKPVGQQYVETLEGEAIDKDAVLFKEHFQLSAPYGEINPVLLPAGLTRDYLDGLVDTTTLKARISHAFGQIAAQNPYTVVEGTGHVGVGSIIDLNNAQVAAHLGLDMVIVASGGLGSTNDELALNLALCERYGVRVRGVILNRVKEDKRQMILDYFPRALAPLGIPLLGCIPYNDYLNTPTMWDFELLFNTKLLSGHKFRFRHFQEKRLVAGSLASYFAEQTSEELIITPASRQDIIEAIIEDYRTRAPQLKIGLILTSRQPPHESTLEQLRSSDIPTLYVPLCSYDAMKQITGFTAKIRREDTRKVAKAIEVVQQHIDFEALCEP